MLIQKYKNKANIHTINFLVYHREYYKWHNQIILLNFRNISCLSTTYIHTLNYKFLHFTNHLLFFLTSLSISYNLLVYLHLKFGILFNKKNFNVQIKYQISYFSSNKYHSINNTSIIYFEKKKIVNNKIIKI